MAFKTIKLEDYTLQLDINAFAEAEEILGPIPVLFAEGNEAKVQSIKVVRALLWAALIEHHPEIDLKGAGKIIEEIGIKRCDEKIREGIVLAYPDVFEKKKA